MFLKLRSLCTNSHILFLKSKINLKRSWKHFVSHFRRSVGWKAYVMNLGFYILFLVMLTIMTVLLENSSKQQNALLDIPRFTIVVMSLFHLLKEIFQIWDEVRHGCESRYNKRIYEKLIRSLNGAWSGCSLTNMHCILQFRWRYSWAVYFTSIPGHAINLVLYHIRAVVKEVSKLTDLLWFYFSTFGVRFSQNSRDILNQSDARPKSNAERSHAFSRA